MNGVVESFDGGDVCCEVRIESIGHKYTVKRRFSRRGLPENAGRGPHLIEKSIAASPFHLSHNSVAPHAAAGIRHFSHGKKNPPNESGGESKSSPSKTMPIPSCGFRFLSLLKYQNDAIVMPTLGCAADLTKPCKPDPAQFYDNHRCDCRHAPPFALGTGRFHFEFFDLLNDFGSMNGNFLARFKSKPNPVSLTSKTVTQTLFANEDFFAHFSSKNQHSIPSLE